MEEIMKKSKKQIDFSNYKKLINDINHSQKKLEECTETIKILKEEKDKDNPYKTLGRVFELYKQGACEDNADWYFYKYLECLENKDKYVLPIGDKDIIEVKINILNPFIEINGEKLLNPRWHLFVSVFAYIDAMYNHPNNDYAKKIIEKTGHPSGKINIRCKSLLTYIQETSN